MIDSGGKWITTLQMSDKLMARIKLGGEHNLAARFDSYFEIDYILLTLKTTSRLATYAPNALKTQEKEFHVKWSPGHSPSPSKALREFSSGDSSPCDDDNQPKQDFIGEKLSHSEVNQMVVNTLTHEIRILEPTKTEKYEKIPPDWQNQRDIILFYFNQSLEACKNKHSIKKYFKEKFHEWPFIVFEDFQKVYVAGEPTYIIRLKDERAAKFFYFNLFTNQQKHKRFLGEQFQVGILRRYKDTMSFTAKVIMRFIPLAINKEKIESIMYESRIDLRAIKAEELFDCNVITYIDDGCKYGVIYCDDLGVGENVVNALNKYFFDRRISQPEIIAINIDGKRISNQRKTTFKAFFEDYKDSIIKLKDTLYKEDGISSPSHCKIYEIPIIRSPSRQARKRNVKSSSESSKKYHEKKHISQKSRTRSRTKRKSGWDSKIKK